MLFLRWFIDCYSRQSVYGLTVINQYWLAGYRVLGIMERIHTQIPQGENFSTTFKLNYKIRHEIWWYYHNTNTCAPELLRNYEYKLDLHCRLSDCKVLRMCITSHFIISINIFYRITVIKSSISKVSVLWCSNQKQHSE